MTQPDEAITRRRAYLLRCWRANGEWRFSLEAVGSPPQRRGFGSLEALMAFLSEEMRGERGGQEAAR